MSLSRSLGRGSRHVAKGSPGRRARSRPALGMVELLENRCLMAVTSTTPVPISVIEGNAFINTPVMSFTASDAGPFTATIIWGDLTTSAGTVLPFGGGFAVTGSHTYAEDGPYTATVTIRDTADNTTVAPTTPATVSESTLTAAGANFSYPENASPTVTTATFTDPGSPDPASSFTASINWGDGTTTPGTVGGAAGSYTVTGSHSYGDEGSFNAVTTFSEKTDPGFTISIGSTATITEADVFTNGAIVIPPASLIEGVSYSGPVATFSDPGFPTNTPADFSATINYGDGTTAPGVITAGPGAGNFTVSGTHTFLEEGTSPITVVVTDNAPGTAAITITGPIIIADAALTATPAVVNGTEGAPLTNVDVATFTDADPFGNASDFLATINWGDGTPKTAGTIVQDAKGIFHVQGSHTYTEENAAVYPVTVSIFDNGGGRAVNDPTDSSATANSTANIRQSPLLPVANSVVGTEGAAIAAGTALATFTDSGGADAVGDYTATVDFGDGGGPVAATVTALGNGGNFQVSSAAAHTYANEGIFPVTVTITDADPTNPGRIPTTAATTSTANIADAPLTASAVQPAVPAQVEGVAFAGAVSSFTDANATAPLSDYAATIDWGDGSPTSLGSFTSAAGVVTVNGTHTYKDNGAFTIRVLTTDVGGMRVTTTTPVIVGDPGLSGQVAVAVRAVEGTSTGLTTFGTFVDPDPNSTAHDWSVAINYGDGSPVGIGQIVLISGDPVSGGNIFAIMGTHTFNEESPLTGAATATITDVDNAAAQATVLPLTITVVDAPLVAAGSSVQAIEGIAFTGQLIATVTDANPFATVADFTTGTGAVTVDWGDGSTSSLTSSPAVTITASGTPNGVVYSIFGSHTYTEEGSHKITVTATDDGGSTSIAHSEADVADALLTAPAQTAISTTESPIFPVPVFGAPIFTGAVGVFDDANPVGTVDDFRATIDWGDGTPQSAGTVMSLPGGVGTSFVVVGSHTYGDSGVNGGAGTFPITVYVNDVGGSKVTIHNTATVGDLVITLTGALDTASDSGISNTDAITNINHPVFHGTSEPFSTVTLFATPTAGGVARQIGQTTAHADGSWKITSLVLLDGSYSITGSAIDQFGKTTTGNTTPATQSTFLPNANQGPLVIDTVGPKVLNVGFNRLNGGVDVVFGDDRSGLDQASLIDSANYQLTKPHTRPATFLVTGLVASGQLNPTDPESVTVIFNNLKVLKGGFYTFTIRDSSNGASSVQDVAGNHLDGEFYGTFPSGNNVPGGDFVARLDAFHNKVFAPQTVVGTANVGNGGFGGPVVGAVHSGHFHITPPRFNTFGGNVLFRRQAAIRHAAAVHQTAVVPHGPKFRTK